MYKPKACARCGGVFQPTHHAVKYCDACRPLAYAEGKRQWEKAQAKKGTGRKPMACERCNVVFIPTTGNAKYCSVCSPLIRMERIKRWQKLHPKKTKEHAPRQCGWCETEFITRSGNTKYCSKCDYHTRRHTSRTGYKPKVCACCGSTFQPLSGHSKYCSKECQRTAINRRHRQRYADDEEYREKLNTDNNQRHKLGRRNPEYCEKEKARRRQRIKENPESYEKEKERFRQRYAEDPEFREKLRSRGNNWTRNNPEKVKAKNKKYNKLEISRIQKRAWKINNPFLVRLGSKRRRARKAAVYHAPYTEEEMLVQLTAQNYLDFYTDEPLFNGSIKPDITEDHIIPIVNGGPDILDNIVFVKMSTNTHKHTKLPGSFIAELVADCAITQEAADRKLIYLRERFGKNKKLLQYNHYL